MRLNDMVHWRIFIMVLLAASLPAMTWAMGDLPKRDKVKTVTEKSTSPAASYWYDGKHKRFIKQDTNVIAELVAPGAKSVLQTKLNTAKAVDKQTSVIVKLWDVSKTGGSIQSLSALNSTMKSTVSPVFINSQAGGHRMALPGGILVTFKAGWDESKVRQWAGSKGLTIKQKLNVGNMYVLNSAVGLASLNLANSIYESGEVESASPNWWHDLRPF